MQHWVVSTMTTCAFTSKVHWAFTFSLSPPLALPEHCHKCSIGSQSFLLLPLSVTTGMSSERIMGSSLLPHFPYCVIGISFLPSLCSTPFMVGFFRDQSSPWSQRYFWTKLALGSVWTSALPWCLASVQCQCFQLQCHLSITLLLPLILAVCLPNCKWWAAGSDCSSRRWELKILFLLYRPVPLSCNLVLQHGEFQSLFQLCVISSGVGSPLYEEPNCHHLFYLCCTRNPPHTSSITSPPLDSPTAVTTNGEWWGKERDFLSSPFSPTIHLLGRGFEWLVRPSHRVQVTGWE